MAAMAPVASSSTTAEEEIYFPDEDWKWTLMFDNINPAFPVELFIQIMERETVLNGFTSERACANVLKHVSDRDFGFAGLSGSLPDDPTDLDGEEKTEKFNYDEPRTLPWKRRFLKQIAGRKVTWEYMKADLLDCFGRKVDVSVDDKLMLLNSLTKGRQENSLHFLIRVKFVVNVIENGRWEATPMKDASQWTKILLLSGLSEEEEAMIQTKKDYENELVLAELLIPPPTRIQEKESDSDSDYFGDQEIAAKKKANKSKKLKAAKMAAESVTSAVKVEEQFMVSNSELSSVVSEIINDTAAVGVKDDEDYEGPGPADDLDEDEEEDEDDEDDDENETEKDKKVRCKKCDLSFRSKAQLRNHMQKSHVGPSSCGICGAQFIKRAELTRHCNQLHNGRRAKCDRCGKELKDEEGLKNHMKLIHDPSRSDLITAQPQLLNTVRSIIRENTRDEGAPESQSPLRNLVTQIVNLKNGKKMYICALCKQQVVGRTEFTLHAKMNHNGHVARCDVCDYTTKSLHALSRHRLGLHDIITDGFKIYYCDRPGCTYKSTDRQKVPHHIRSVHDNIRPFKCEFCEKSFATRGAHKLHVENVHMGLRRFSCDECGETFKTLCHFKDHKATRHGDAPPPRHVCEECGGSFTKLNTLQKHIRRVHRMEKNVECPHCPGKWFFSNTRLKFHFRTVHQLDKKYVCPQCDKGFRNNCEVKKHISVFHLKIKSFRCKICNTYFTKGCNLCYHIGVQHMGMTPAESREKTRLAKAHEAYEHIREEIDPSLLVKKQPDPNPGLHHSHSRPGTMTSPDIQPINIMIHGGSAGAVATHPHQAPSAAIGIAAAPGVVVPHHTGVLHASASVVHMMQTAKKEEPT